MLLTKNFYNLKGINGVLINIFLKLNVIYVIINVLILIRNCIDYYFRTFVLNSRIYSILILFEKTVITFDGFVLIIVVGKKNNKVYIFYKEEKAKY